MAAFVTSTAGAITAPRGLPRGVSLRRPMRDARLFPPSAARVQLSMGLFDALRAAVGGGPGAAASTASSPAVFAGAGAGGRPQTLAEDPVLARYVERVAAINAREDDVEALSNDELRARVSEISRSLAESLVDVDGVLEEVFAIVREASFRVLGIRHFDVQLVGGMVLHDGKIAEMATGEGKTYVAALPAVLNALAGTAVCIVTVNDYLAKRDAELIGQIYRFLGLSVGLIQSASTPSERRDAYACDITYVTNSELGFDYLRDNLALKPEDVVIVRAFGFCIVDEADSILIDEARTPLIISGKIPAPTAKYATAAKAATQLEKDVHYAVDEKEQTVLLSEEGYAVVESALNVSDLFDVQNPWAPYITNALKAKELFSKDVNYIVREEQKDIQIVDEFTGRVMEGRRWSDGLHQAVEAKEGLQVDSEATTIASVSYQAFFKLFPKLSGMTGTAATEAEEIEEIYGLNVLVVPTALPCARKDYQDVIFRNAQGKYRAVMAEIARVAPTGRPVLIGTTSIEASEALSKLLAEVEVPHEVLNARPEFALRESEIIAQAGRMYSITIATNMAGRGTDIVLGGNVDYYARALARKEIVSHNKELYATLSQDSEFSVLIDDEDLPCEISEETLGMLAAAVSNVTERNNISSLLEIDQLVSIAAEYGPIPEAMDGIAELRQAIDVIKDDLSQIVNQEREAVVRAGGLYVIGTERAESRRVDNQLRGRAGRQGDPGGSRFFLALDDRLFRIFGGDKVTGILETFRVDENTPIESKAVTSSLDGAQQNVERYYADIRKQLFTYDEVMSTQRAVIYSRRRGILMDDDDVLQSQLHADCLETAKEIERNFTGRSTSAENNYDGLSSKLNQFFPGLLKCGSDELISASQNAGPSAHIVHCVSELVAIKNKSLDEVRPGMSRDVKRFLYLTQIDNLWQSHMKSMDYLKEFMGLRAFGQEDPLQAYQTEGYELFTAMMENLRRNTVFSYFQYKRSDN
jgi:preprotein translocase subunit SecA